MSAAAALELEVPVVIRTFLLSILGCIAALGAPPVAASECHGPVGKNETLWPIALRLRPDPSIGPHRMMLALLKANPEAFTHHNVNTLEAGVTLCVGPEDPAGFDDAAAIAEIARQNQEWRTGRMRRGAGSDEPVSAPPAPAGVDEAALVLPAGIVAGLESRLAEVEGRIGDPESGPVPEQVERALARLETRVAGIEERLEALAARVETMVGAGDPEAMEPMPTPAPASPEAMEPMPTPAPASREAMEPMPTPAPVSSEAMEPMPTPAPVSSEAMEPMPTPAPTSPEAMEPMPTPAPASPEAMEPMPTPAPASPEAMEPMPTPAPASPEAMEPMPTPAPVSSEAMEPMPTPAPASPEAMEPMPTPAPASPEAMEPMPTPAPASPEAMEPMPTPAPASAGATAGEPASVETLTTESISARIDAWRERVRELRKR